MDTVFTAADRLFMTRALELARHGLGHVAPNPMVGAVIVSPRGLIIGEGYHRQYGGPHAEVNAVRSVSETDRPLLCRSTIYVTLEPCAHYGKTPPCANLIADTCIPRVIIGSIDPFAKVHGRGVAILRDAGCEVLTGLMSDESQSLNARFFTAHTLGRPFVTLKWARSLDGFMDRQRSRGEGAMKFSTTVGATLVHRLRANHESIIVGSGTALADTPRLDVRLWSGKNPRRIVLDRRGRLGRPTSEFAEILTELYSQGITSVLVEGGSTLLASIIEAGLWDLARVETSPVVLGDKGTANAPVLPAAPFASRRLDTNVIHYFSNNPLANNYFIDNGL